VRILCLGDSLTWGYGANDEETYPALLEVLLGKRYPELNVQVLNAGVPGYGTDEELELLRTRGAALEPDLVIVLFFAGNDFEDNRSPARVTLEIRDGMLVDKVLSERARSRPRWVRVNDWLKSRSHLHSFVSKRVGYLLMRAGVLGRLEQASSEYFTDEDARRATDLLVEISQTADRLGARSLFVFAPEKMQVFSDAEPPFRAATVVQQAATRAGVPWIDLTPALMQRATRSELHYKQDAHWTPAGNRVVAGVLADQIARLGLTVPSSKNPHHVSYKGATGQ
jgi:lysophospholipase L1-like esterase